MSKIYLPSEYINSNYKYILSSDGRIDIRTNLNCYNTGTNMECDCYTIFPNYDYTVTPMYHCRYNSTTSSNYILSYTNFTSDIWYRSDIVYILIIFLILFIFIIKYPMRIFMRLFGRWLKL